MSILDAFIPLLCEGNVGSTSANWNDVHDAFSDPQYLGPTNYKNGCLSWPVSPSILRFTDMSTTDGQRSADDAMKSRTPGPPVIYLSTPNARRRVYLPSEPSKKDAGTQTEDGRGESDSGAPGSTSGVGK